MNKKPIIMATLYIVEAAAVGIFLYLVLLPFYPVLKYDFFIKKTVNNDAINLEKAKEDVLREFKSLPVSDYSISPNRLIIKKIGVNAPIVESESSEIGLSKGAWHVPQSSTPDKKGNTVITGHRFKYLPPNNLTFYLFDKLLVGDTVSVVWKEKSYIYRVVEIKIVPDTDLSVLTPSDKALLTMFTCHPIFSTEKRLVVISELITE